MSLIGDLMTKAITTISSAEGSVVVEYRATSSDAWVSIPNAIFHERVGDKEYDDLRGQFVQNEAAQLTIPEGSPDILEGYQVRVASTDIWHVSSQITKVNQQRFELSRAPLDNYGPDRGDED